MGQAESRSGGKIAGLVGSTSRPGNVFRLVVSAALLALLLWPIFRSPQVDSFPLSNYPMFSGTRSRTSTVNLAVGLNAAGDTVTLSPESIAGSDQVIHAARAVGDAVRGESTDALCAEVARRVAATDSTAVTIQIATERFDVVRWFDGDKEPDSRTVHHECPVR